VLTPSNLLPLPLLRERGQGVSIPEQTKNLQRRIDLINSLSYTSVRIHRMMNQTTRPIPYLCSFPEGFIKQRRTWMKRIRVIHWLLGFILCFGIVISLTGGQAAIASDNSTLPQSPSQETPPLEEKLELKSPYPVLKEKAGNLFEFQVELHYHGSKSRVFDLSVVSTSGAYVDIIAPFTVDKGIESILVKPDEEYPDTVKVRYNPALSGQKEPGKYVITLRASSGDISDSIDLTAVVTGRYELFINTSSGRLNANITSGEDNHIGILMKNTGATALENVRFSANVPQGWGVAFHPDKVESLNATITQESDMVITPPSNTIAGDYEITVMAISSEALSEMKLRITVTTPTIWGWIAVIIVVVVIAGLAVTFIRLGRR
jgi:hypothetical protein